MYLSTGYQTLTEWLSHMERVHATRIELGLDRVKAVAERLDLLQPNAVIIIVGGTNGKGSTVSALNQLYLAEGYRVGTFTSPYLFKYNEEFTINNRPVTDAALCHAFSHIEAARDHLPLTIFEYGLLAALFIFKRAALEVIILEVGLGGRLDAVNIIDADLSIITSIDIDHTDWLGSTREAIGYEKAGIMRSRRPVVCGDVNPPATVTDYAKSLSAAFYQQGVDFHYHQTDTTWSWRSKDQLYTHLPCNALAMQNMSTVLMAVTLLQSVLPITESAIKLGLQQTILPGRIEVISGKVIEIYDVAHNPAAVLMLAAYIASTPCLGKTHAVFSMLKDKDILNCLRCIQLHIDDWFIASIKTERGANLQILHAIFQESGINKVQDYADLATAYQAAKSSANPNDRIIIFGSFYVVAEVQKAAATFNACAVS